jgi:hypothetical protein
MSTKVKATLENLTKQEQEMREKHKDSDRSKGMTIASRMTLFFVFPLLIGSIGLITSYLQHNLSKDPRPMDFDRDFVQPFLITLVLVVVVSIQTGNFSTYNAKPLVSWPKVVKKKKIIHKTVLVDDDGNVIEDENILNNIKTAENKKAD